MPKPKLPSPAFVLAFVALAVALGGSAVALTGAERAAKNKTIKMKNVKANPETGPSPCADQTGIFCGNDSISGYRGWKNFGGGYEGVSYGKDSDGVVHLQGTAYAPGPPGGLTIFVLPKALRPDGLIETVVPYGVDDPCGVSEDCKTKFAHLSVTRQGEVQAVGASPDVGYPHLGVSLDGVTFVAK